MYYYICTTFTCRDNNFKKITFCFRLSQLLKLLSGSGDLVGLNSAEDKLHVLITELKDRGGLEDELQGLADEAEELGQVN